MLRFLRGEWRGHCLRLFLLASVMFLAPAARAQVGCGGEGQSTCTIGDSEFYSNNNYAGCQYDLQADGNFAQNLVGDSNCINKQRYTLTQSMSGQQSWAAWALAEQRNGIGANAQLNWITTLGSHNSYSSSQQGYTVSLGQNQIYSITDQLNAGARILELDPHTYLKSTNGGHLTVCHGSPYTLAGVELATADDECFVTALTHSGLYAREFQAVLGEIAHWMAANPNEVLVLFIDVGGSDNYIAGSEQDLENDIVNVLGSKVWTVADTVNNNGHVPSIAAMRQKGRSVILIANTNLNIQGVHVFDTVGNLYGSVQGAFPSNNNDQVYGGNSSGQVDSAFNTTTCLDGDGHAALARGQDAWFRLGEARSGSDWFSAGGSQPLINEGEVQTATGCAASYVELDFLYARDQVPTDGYRGGPDTRFDSGVWSWQSGDYGQTGRPTMQAGRWVSTPTIDASGNPVLRQAACLAASPASSYGQRQGWVLTANPIVFGNAESECNTEYQTHFAVPMNGYENGLVSKLGDGFWLNYKSSNLGDPYTTSAVTTFQYPQGTVPKAQTFQIIGQPDKTVAISLSLPSEEIQFAVNGKVANSITLDANGSAIVQVTMVTPQLLAPGIYVEPLHLAYADGSGQASALLFQALVQIQPSITLGPAITMTQGATWTPAVTLNLNPSNVTSVPLGIETGTVSVLEQLVDSKGNPYVNQLASTSVFLATINQANPISFSSIFLGPGTHSLIASFVPSDPSAFQMRVSSSAITVIEIPELTFSPAQVAFNTMAGSNNAPAQNVSVIGSKAPISVESGATWLSAVVSQQQITLSLTSAAASLAPGTYTTLVAALDTTTQNKDTFTIQLSVQGVLSSSVNSLALAAYTSSVTGSAIITTTGTGQLPLTITTPSWLTPSVSSATTPVTIGFSASTSTYPTGTHLTGSITIKSPQAANELSIPVDFYVVQPTEISGVGIGSPSVNLDNVRISLPATLALIPGTQHTLDASENLLDPGDSKRRWVFRSWDSGSPAVFTFTAPANAKSAYAVTYGEQDLLTTAISPATTGTVSFSPVSTDGYFDKGSSVTLTATPTTGFTFVGYSGAVTSINAVTPIIVSAPKNVIATFSAAATPVTITFTTNAPGAPFQVNGATLTLPAQVTMTPGQPYSLSAGLQFNQALDTRWNFASLNQLGMSSQSYVAPSQNASVSVVYQEQFQLSAVSNPPAGGTLSGGGWYNSGTIATVQAAPGTGYALGSFSGPLDSTSNPLSVQMNAPVIVTGNFSTGGGPSLYVTAAGQRTDAPSFPGLRIVPLEIVNRTGGGVGDVQITGLDNINVVSGSGPVQSQNLFPFKLGNLTANGSGIFNLLMNWPATAARVSFTVHFIGNGGTYSGSTTVTLNR